MKLPETTVRKFDVQLRSDVAVHFAEPTTMFYDTFAMILDPNTTKDTGLLARALAQLMVGYDESLEERTKFISELPIADFTKIQNGVITNLNLMMDNVSKKKVGRPRKG